MEVARTDTTDAMVIPKQVASRPEIGRRIEALWHFRLFGGQMCREEVGRPGMVRSRGSS